MHKFIRGKHIMVSLFPTSHLPRVPGGGPEHGPKLTLAETKVTELKFKLNEEKVTCMRAHTHVRRHTLTHSHTPARTQAKNAKLLQNVGELKELKQRQKSARQTVQESRQFAKDQESTDDDVDAEGLGTERVSVLQQVWLRVHIPRGWILQGIPIALEGKQMHTCAAIPTRFPHHPHDTDTTPTTTTTPTRHRQRHRHQHHTSRRMLLSRPKYGNWKTLMPAPTGSKIWRRSWRP